MKTTTFPCLARRGRRSVGSERDERMKLRTGAAATLAVAGLVGRPGVVIVRGCSGVVGAERQRGRVLERGRGGGDLCQPDAATASGCTGVPLPGEQHRARRDGARCDV